MVEKNNQADALRKTLERLAEAEGLLARMKFELDRHGDSYHHATDRQVLNDYDAYTTPRDPARDAGGTGDKQLKERKSNES